MDDKNKKTQKKEILTIILIALIVVFMITWVVAVLAMQQPRPIFPGPTPEILFRYVNDAIMIL